MDTRKLSELRRAEFLTRVYHGGMESDCEQNFSARVEIVGRMGRKMSYFSALQKSFGIVPGLDYGPTQEYKKQRVKEVLGALPRDVQYIPMDFTKDDLLSQLRTGGYSEKERSLFIWKGVTQYIQEAAVKDTLHLVREHCAPGSTIVFDYSLSSDSRVNDPNSRFARRGEPWIFGFPGDSAGEFVRREGLTIASDVFFGRLTDKVCATS